MSLGCPVICSNISAIKEIGGEAARYFDPNNIDDMTTAIEQTINSEENRKILIRKGFEKNRDYSWTKCARETLAIYNNVI
jgi:glycosyltransferase involved in cell wall biosynthesis